jgi:Tfp pilus assembly protein PilF
MTSEKVATSNRTKILLVIAGIFMALILLEFGLRFGGGVFSMVQDYKNRCAIRTKNAYRILCLGESTTQDQYPKPLEKILNDLKLGLNFVVIDKGRNSITTMEILALLPRLLDQFQPDMVITMIGVNDYGPWIPDSMTQEHKTVLRVVKLWRYLLKHLPAKWAEIKSRHALMALMMRAQASTDTAEQIKNNDQEVTHPLEAFPDKEHTGDPSSTASADTDDMTRCFGNKQKGAEYVSEADRSSRYNYCLERAKDYIAIMEFSKAEKYLKAAIELYPKYLEGNLLLGNTYLQVWKFKEAEAILSQAYDLCPGDENVCKGLLLSLWRQKKDVSAREAFQKCILANPRCGGCYTQMGDMFRKRHELVQAKEYYRRALEIMPCDTRAVKGLCWLYVSEKNYRDARSLVTDFLRCNRGGNFDYLLAAIYESEGDIQQANYYYELANKVKMEGYNYYTKMDYQRIRDILVQRNIPLIAVQYPLLDINALKKNFDGDENGIIFVDNQEVFREAIRYEGYASVFLDCAAGFGHATKRGNQLLAENIANILVKEFFQKKSLIPSK